jgi:hypothetical protein
VVAGSSVLGMLIPPSLLMIVYSVPAEESVGRTFLAGVGRRPDAAGKLETSEQFLEVLGQT